MRILSVFGLAFVLLAPTTARAQHTSPRALFDPPSAAFALGCTIAPPPSRSMPGSVLSYRFFYGAMRTGTADGLSPLEQHQQFTIVWDSAGRLLMFGVRHEKTSTDSLSAGFVITAAADSFDGKWLFVNNEPRIDPMTADEIRDAKALADIFWTRRCPGVRTQ